jgi:hypothetical protein
MSSVSHLCLVCQSGFDPDDEVLRAIHTAFEMVGGEEISREETRFAHVHEKQAVERAGWTVTDQGKLRDVSDRQ